MISCRASLNHDRYNTLMSILEDCLEQDKLNDLYDRIYHITVIYGRIHTTKQELILKCLDKGTIYESEKI